MSPIINRENIERRNTVHIAKFYIYLAIAIVSNIGCLCTFSIFIYLLVTDNEVYYAPLLLSMCAFLETSISYFIAYMERKLIVNISQVS